MYEQLIASFRLDNYPLLAVSALTFFFGYMEYIYSFRLMRREGKAPYLVWMHTFYFAHDSSWAVIMFIAASRHHWYWFFVITAVALMIWNCFEIYNIYKAVTVEREEIWGEYYGAEVTVRQALTNITLQVSIFYCVINLLIGFMGEGSILQWFLLTNMLIAAAPGILWMKRGRRNNNRDGASMGLAILILLATINTFLPTSMWVQAMPSVFNTPWYYISGVIFTTAAAYNIYALSKLPPKPVIPGEKRPIW